MDSSTQIAIIGTGMAATALADRLMAAGLNITCYEKSRGTGGRLSTRRTENLAFDHGAPFFTVRDTRFRQWLENLSATDTVITWNADEVTLSADEKPYRRPWFEPHYVTTPQMNQLCKRVLADHTRFATTITGITGSPGEWHLQSTERDFGPYDWVISSAPAEQTATLLSPYTSGQLDNVSYQPCFALMGQLTSDVPAWDAAVVKNAPLAWLMLNQRRPGRDPQPAVVAHSSGAWAAENFEADRDEVLRTLAACLKDIAHLTLENTVLHRWKYASVITPFAEPFWLANHLGLAACGDWCGNGRVEAAFLSGDNLAKKLLELPA